MIGETFAVLSDIHGNRWALEAVLNDMERKGVRRAVNLGDSLYGPLDPQGTASVLLDQDWPTVCGNEDRIITEADGTETAGHTLRFVRKSLKREHVRWLKSLKMTASPHDLIFLCHGTPRRDNEYMLSKVTAAGVERRPESELVVLADLTDSHVLLCGHDHTPGSVTLGDGRRIVNPGSVGLPAYEDDDPHPHIIETRAPHACYSVLSATEGGWSVERVAVDYDRESAASAAERNERPDWAKWLRTGRAR